MSIFPTTILLATDGSDEGKMATQAAAELSRDTGSEVHVTYVLPTPQELIGHHYYSSEIRESLIEQARSEARKFLEQRVEQLKSDGAKVIGTHLRTGEPDKEGPWRGAQGADGQRLRLRGEARPLPRPRDAPLGTVRSLL